MEAELMASSPERVADWLKARDPSAGRFLEESCDDDLEENLLSRGERLIDLALARYGSSEEVLRSLFQRIDETIRMAVLANERHHKGAFLTHWRFASADEEDLSWVAGLTDNELAALFANPALPDEFLIQFFEGKLWTVLSDEQRLRAAWQLAQNVVVWTEEVDSWDGWANYRSGLVKTAAWSMADRVEVTPKWATLLGHLYRQLPASAPLKFQPLDALRRWKLGPEDSKEVEMEARYNSSGDFSSFQEVRRGLARLASKQLHNSDKAKNVILGDNDIAVRCGAYLSLNFSVEEIEAAIEKDGLLACSSLVENDKVWRKMETREALQEACSRLSKEGDYLLSPSHRYHRKGDQVREQNPSWFDDEEWHEDEHDDKPLTDSTIAEISEAISKSWGLRGLQSRIENQTNAETIRFWVVMILLIVIAFQV